MGKFAILSRRFNLVTSFQSRTSTVYVGPHRPNQPATARAGPLQTEPAPAVPRLYASARDRLTSAVVIGVRPYKTLGCPTICSFDPTQ